MAPLATKQPFKALYIAQRTLSSLALIPFWYLKYLHVSARPRTSWTALEAVVVRFIRRMIYMNEATGIMLDRTDKTKQVDDSTLKETSFVWLDAVDESLVHGIAKNEDVKPVRIPGYIWPKGAKVEEAEGYVGYWVHGGAYRMGNGSENFGPSEIPRYISKNSRIKTVLSLDYRLSGEARHPAQLLDALAGIWRLCRDASINDALALPLGREDPPPPRWTDVVLAYETVNENSVHPNSQCDVLQTSVWFPLQLLPDPSSTSLLNSPYFSSNRAPAESFTGYPKTFISLGDAEVFLEEGKELAEKMRKAAVDVTLDVQRDAVHDFWGFPPIVPNEKARVELKKHVLIWIETLPAI